MRGYEMAKVNSRRVISLASWKSRLIRIESVPFVCGYRGAFLQRLVSENLEVSLKDAHCGQSGRSYVLI